MGLLLDISLLVEQTFEADLPRLLGNRYLIFDFELHERETPFEARLALH